MLVVETNRYVEQISEAARTAGVPIPYAARNWVEVDHDEMKRFIGLFFSLALSKSQYWKNFGQPNSLHQHLLFMPLWDAIVSWLSTTCCILRTTIQQTEATDYTTYGHSWITWYLPFAEYTSPLKLSASTKSSYCSVGDWCSANIYPASAPGLAKKYLLFVTSTATFGMQLSTVEDCKSHCRIPSSSVTPVLSSSTCSLTWRTRDTNHSWITFIRPFPWVIG